MTKKKGIDFRIIISVVAAITIIECVALYTGHNGFILTTVIAILAGLAGLSLPQLKVK